MVKKRSRKSKAQGGEQKREPRQILCSLCGKHDAINGNPLCEECEILHDYPDRARQATLLRLKVQRDMGERIRPRPLEHSPSDPW